MYLLQERDDDMKLWKYSGKHIKITADDGQVFEGIAQDYVSELDNPSGVSCISIGDIEFEENEIVKIEVISADTPTMANAV